jgi:hypothetical protein
MAARYLRERITSYPVGWLLAGRSCAREFAENASASSTTALRSLADYPNTFTIGVRSDYDVSGARRRTT